MVKKRPEAPTACVYAGNWFRHAVGTGLAHQSHHSVKSHDQLGGNDLMKSSFLSSLANLETRDFRADITSFTTIKLTPRTGAASAHFCPS